MACFFELLPPPPSAHAQNQRKPDRQGPKTQSSGSTSLGNTAKQSFSSNFFHIHCAKFCSLVCPDSSRTQEWALIYWLELAHTVHICKKQMLFTILPFCQWERCMVTPGLIMRGSFEVRQQTANSTQLSALSCSVVPAYEFLFLSPKQTL